MVKVVINRCFGRFNLSPKAIEEYLKLKGKKAYFFKWEIKPDKMTPLTRNEANKELCPFVFTHPDPDEYLKGLDERSKQYNEKYKEISFSVRDLNRSDPDLIKVVEKLGKDASGRYSELKVVEIPDDVEWEISEYDGLEKVEEKHRSWR